MKIALFHKVLEVINNTCCYGLLYKLSVITISTICPACVVLYYWGRRRQCLRPIVTAPLLVGICVTWTGVCLGRPYLPGILKGGFMDVSIGRRFVSFPFSIVLYF